MRYAELKERQSAELNAFPMFFAFDTAQFEAGKQKLGVTENAELASIPDGGVIKKIDADALLELLTKFDTELADAMREREFMIDAIAYELANHEYGYTGNRTSALEVLGIALDTQHNQECFAAARKRVLAQDKEDNGMYTYYDIHVVQSVDGDAGCSIPFKTHKTCQGKQEVLAEALLHNVIDADDAQYVDTVTAIDQATYEKMEVV